MCLRGCRRPMARTEPRPPGTRQRPYARTSLILPAPNPQSRWFGRSLALPRPYNTRQSMKVVVFCPSPIGDAVMATPMLRALRRDFAGATFLGVLKPLIANALEGSPWFDERILFDPN